jgi:hypothetical protein
MKRKASAESRGKADRQAPAVATGEDWRFVQSDERRPTWSWHHSGSEPASAYGFASYAAAAMDAVRRGFRPKIHAYVVEQAGRFVRFAPGQRPAPVYEEPAQAQPRPPLSGQWLRRG